jgi:DNA polymerase-3 subunit beta
MHVETSRLALKAALVTVKRTVQKRPSIPALAFATIEAEAGQSSHPRIGGTDLETAVRVRLPGEATGSEPHGVFPIPVPAHELSSFVSKAKADTVTIEKATPDGDSVSVTAGPLTVKLASIPDGELPGFPAIPDMMAPGWYPVSVDTLRELSPVAYAMSRDETRYHLNGIHSVNLACGRLRWEATDGHRLAQADSSEPACIPVPGAPAGLETAEKYTAILPAALVTELCKLAKARKPQADTVRFHGDSPAGRPWISASFGAVTVCSRIIDGQYPNTAQVIPAASSKRPAVTVSRPELLEAVEALLPLAPERSGAVKLTVNGAVKLETDNGNGESGELSIDGHHTGDAVTVGVNGHYLREALRSFSGNQLPDTVALSFAPGKSRDGTPEAGLSPIRIDTDTDSVFSIVMPMRL